MGSADDHSDDRGVRWRKVGEMFSAALELSREEREQFLDEECAGDRRLRAEVVELLEAGDAAGDFLAVFDADVASRLLREGGADTSEDRRVGPYRLDREIGRGGMGVVYLAHRDDGQFEQRVALKLIKRGMDSEAVLRRFMLERQILARLQHPNIARLHDGGITAEGQPYFAMEYVEGTPLTKYCDAKRVDIAKRLKLFSQVCLAVAYAHQSLVVHRDLKPSNMLVTDDGAVKLLDFGIAKLLEGDGDSLTTLTRTGDRPMTPQYASPEQVAGHDVTTATDVYALGTVLYELLAGRRVHGKDRDAGSRVDRLIQPSSAVVRHEGSAGKDVDSASPAVIASRRLTSVNRLRKRLAGDLDRIAMKALSDDPARRYRSAEALLNDVERYLQGLPVEATGESAPYRLGKFVRRHAIGVSASVAILASLTVGLGTAVWQAQEKAAEAARAEQISEFLVDLFVASDPDEARRSDLTAQELLSAGLARLDTGLVGQPDLQAEIFYTVGQVFMKLGLYPEAEDAHRKGLRLREAVFGLKSEPYAASLVEVVTALRGQARFAEASELLRDVVAIRREVGSDDDVEFALTLYDLASLAAEKEADFDGAEALTREALDILKTRLGDEHEQLARGYSQLASVLYSKGEYGESVDVYRTAIDMWTRLVGERHRSTTKAMSGMANSLGRLGRSKEAEQLFRKALALRRDLLGNEHPDVATNLNNLGFLLTEMGDFEGAVEVYLQACSIYRNRLGEDHWFHAVCTSNLGTALAGAGRYQEAEDLLLRSFKVLQAQFGADHPSTATVQHKTADLYARMGRDDKAVTYYRNALRTRTGQLGGRHPNVAETQVGLAAVLQHRGEIDEAEALLEAALENQAETLGASHPAVETTRHALAQIRDKIAAR